MVQTEGMSGDQFGVFFFRISQFSPNSIYFIPFYFYSFAFSNYTSPFFIPKFVKVRQEQLARAVSCRNCGPEFNSWCNFFSGFSEFHFTNIHVSTSILNLILFLIHSYHFHIINCKKRKHWPKTLVFKSRHCLKVEEGDLCTLHGISEPEIK